MDTMERLKRFCTTIQQTLACTPANLDDKKFALEGKSTTHALVYFLHVILQSLDDSHSFVRVFFADFSKGLDLVDHNALVLEMQCLEIGRASCRERV